MYQLSLISSHYQNPQEKVDLRWNINQTPTGLIWTKLFKEVLEEKSRPFSRNTGFIYGPKSMEYLSRVLNHCIKIINDEGSYRIEERADGNWSQDFSNSIHHHFEILAGTVERPSKYIKNKPFKYQSAIMGLNHMTHDMECLQRSLERKDKFPETYFSGLIMEMLDCRRYDFPDFVFDEFTLSTKFGGLHLHYAQIGKTWWEVFLDQDDHIFPEAIEPHFALSGEFDAYFGEYSPDEKTMKEFTKFLIDNNQDPNNKYLCLGYCPIGELNEVEQQSRESWRKMVGEHCHVEEIRLLKNNSLIQSKKYDRTEAYSYLLDIPY